MHIRPRNGAFYVEVSRKGIRDSATFDTKSEARRWGIKREAEILRGEKPGRADKTFKDAMDEYARKVSPGKGGYRWEALRLKKIGRDKIGTIPLSELSKSHFADWRDRMLAGDEKEGIRPLKPGSVRREMNLISAVLTTAVEEWEWLPISPLKGVKWPAKPAPKLRRITPEERENVLWACDYRPDVPPVTDMARVGAAFDFAIETGMRSGEICRLTKADDSGRYVKVRFGKTNAAKRDVPLTPRARAILDQLLPLELPTVFGLDDQSRDALFRKALKRSGVTGLTFHASRHEAASTLSKKLPVNVLAKILGLVDLSILMSVYYNPTGDELADHLDGKLAAILTA